MKLYNNIIVTLDIYGNMYFSMSENDDECYQLNINGKDELYLDYFKYTILDNISYPCKPFLVEENNLKKQVEKDLEELNELEDIDDEDEEEIYIPEDEDIYLEKEDDYNCDIFNADNDEFCDEYYFEFYSNNKNNANNTETKIIERNEDIGALYNSYIYKNTELILLSRSNSSTYIVKIFNDATILFRPIGSKEKKYYLVFESNIIKLVKQ